MIAVTILGSTGSVGVSTLDVIARHPDKYRVFALSANHNVDELFRQCLVWSPEIAVMADPAAAGQLATALSAEGSATRVLAGAEALCEIAAHPGTDAVMAAIVGGAGLASSLAAVQAGKRMLLANKESLVMSGHLFMEAAHRSGADILPIDSEHNAIFQSMANGAGSHAAGIRKILLTGSGGPFRTRDLNTFGQITPAEACRHPNWSMGRKISVDSATMMNKGLEVIEARWLFDVPVADIEVVVHPQSIVHSMVDYIDGSVVCQMGNPDMRTPIAHGLAWPRRIDSGVAPLDLINAGSLTFEVPDYQRFPCLRLARAAAEAEQSLSVALNAANEIAVQGFLDELISFTDIPVIIEKVMAGTDQQAISELAEVLALDEQCRQLARGILKSMSKNSLSGAFDA
ncbi:MAG: 1-deoxy-D-xylulose-5-phosphate reductoisomerase [Pseudomonadales bacterium]|nr:1-deoxy-D-xylulose-5-phosphate reductoisomerase [Pseudomonadales bacterium]